MTFCPNHIFLEQFGGDPLNLFREHGMDATAVLDHISEQRIEAIGNADQNASRVIAQRGIRLLLEGTIQKKRVRRCGIGKEKQLGGWEISQNF